MHAKRYDADGLEIVSPEDWRSARAHGHAHIWDGRRYMLRLYRGAMVVCQVIVEHPLIERKRRDGT